MSAIHWLIDKGEDFDMGRLARLTFTFKNLIEQFNPQTCEDKLLIAAALELNANDLRNQIELARREPKET